ncbi:MAG: MMPL family transporter, partial [Alphaproteobacteria bacterium]|nr:MMPL family transporter [Alphaproteobacteria bacterium]
DYGIYLYAQLQRFLKEGDPFPSAYRKAVQTTGAAIFFTGVTLSLSTLIWNFSPLKFQSDMGRLLSFMFFANMLGALIFLPIIHVVLDQVKGWIVNRCQTIGMKFAAK